MNIDTTDASKRSEVLHNLVEHRKNSKMRQIDVAVAMGIGQPAVSELERGETSPKLETLQRYARAIGVTLNIYLSPTDIEDGTSDD